MAVTPPEACVAANLNLVSAGIASMDRAIG